MNKLLRIALMMQGGREWLGGTEYIKNIILALGNLPSDVRSTFEIYLVSDSQLDDGLQKQLESYLSNIFYNQLHCEPLTLTKRICRKISQPLFKQSNNPKLEAFFKKEKIDFVYPYFTQNNLYNSYKAAAWIFDFQHKYLPQFFSEKETRQRDECFANIARQASTIVLSSKAAEADFHKFFPEADHKTKVLSFKTYPTSKWYEGNPQEVQKEYYLPDRFFLVSNQFWQHKNHLTVFKALKILQEKGIYPNIVCTGHIYDYRLPEYSNIILQTIHQLGIAKQIYLLGLIPKLSQVQLMRRSLAVIQPSLFEGWSTLVEDAKCLGKKMIISDLPVNIEQDPPNSVFFKRNSAEHLASFLADWWEHLQAGPDLEIEATAKKNCLEEVQSFGIRFLEIAKGC